MQNEVETLRLEVYGLPYYFGIDPDAYYVIHKNRECTISYTLDFDNFKIIADVSQMLIKFDFTIDMDCLAGSEYLRISEMSRECIITARQISGTKCFLNVEDFEVQWNVKNFGHGGRPTMVALNLSENTLEVY